MQEYGNKDIALIVVVTLVLVAVLCGLILVVFNKLDKIDKDK